MSAFGSARLPQQQPRSLVQMYRRPPRSRTNVSTPSAALISMTH